MMWTGFANLTWPGRYDHIWPGPIVALWQVSIRQPDVRDGVPVRGELWGVCGADPTAAALPGTQGPHTVLHQVEECPPPPSPPFHPLQSYHHHHQGDKHQPEWLRLGGGQGGPGKVPSYVIQTALY